MSRKHLLGTMPILLALALGCTKSASTEAELVTAGAPTQPTKPAEPSARAKDIHTSQANLANIGAAFNDKPTAVPAGFADKSGKLLLSWRVALLPALGKEDLLRKFKLSEPWDSEHNKKLIAQMPDVYKPVRGNAPEGHTFYCVFQGEETFFAEKYPPIAGLAYGQLCVPAFSPRPLTNVPDRPDGTYLVVEAGAAVPWTKPDELSVAKGKPFPQLGGLFEGDYNVLLCDTTTVVLVRKEVAEDQRRAAATAIGAEPVDPAALGKK